MKSFKTEHPDQHHKLITENPEVRSLLEKDELTPSDRDKLISVVEDLQRDTKDERTKISNKIQELILIYTFITESLRKMGEEHCRFFSKSLRKNRKVINKTVLMLQRKEKELIQITLKEIASLLQKREPLNKDFSNEDLELLYSVATSLHHAGEMTQAREIFHQLALSNPLTQKYWKGLGSCLQNENSWEKAAKAWKMATLIEREDPLSYLNLAECCFFDERF